MNTWYTVHGAFAPTPAQFDNEADAIAHAQASVNDWAKDVSVVKSEVIWRADGTTRI